MLAEWMGYAASLFLILSLSVTNSLKFRWLNAAGCAFFVVYGALLGAIPVLLTNGILLAINIYYLVSIYRYSEKFDLLSFRADDQVAHQFIDYYEKGIKDYFPHFKREQIGHDQCINFFVLRDMAIANMFSASITPAGEAIVHINFTVEKFRDYKVGRYIFKQEKQYLRDRGIQKIVYQQMPNRKHIEFLKVMGFVQEGDYWVKLI
ncbi:hypothetical protein ACFS6H_19240 [Terrimonas rubra]|uniref:Inner membrane protein n=1 Tax=Terrimonas rubra TaxID=1035890 RepID=A0ABW6ADQ3_9BACT